MPAPVRAFPNLELEGKLSPDRDLDADEGAVLIFPSRIVRVPDQLTS